QDAWPTLIAACSTCTPRSLRCPFSSSTSPPGRPPQHPPPRHRERRRSGFAACPVRLPEPRACPTARPLRRLTGTAKHTEENRSPPPRHRQERRCRGPLGNDGGE